MTTRVLLVDDAPDLRLLGRTVLASAGFTVDEAANGPEALTRLANSHDTDVVVLDVQMPEMDGWDTLAAIRANPTTAATRVVLCTVKEHPRDQLRAWELGADGYIAKPFAVRDLVDTVSAAARRDELDRIRVRTAEARVARRRLAEREERNEP